MNLVEIPAGAVGHDVERRMADNRAVRIVHSAEKHQPVFADLDLDRALIGLERPGERRIGIGIEAHGDDAIADRIGRRIGALRRSAIARRAAEEIV